MESNREESWIENVFEGDPPDGYKGWFDWATSKQKTGAYIRRAEPSDWKKSPAKTEWDGIAAGNGVSDDTPHVQRMLSPKDFGAVPDWDGNGYPPIGCECEVYHYEDWRRCEILAHRDSLVLYYVPGFIRQKTGSTSGQWFRPIRTKEQKERDGLLDALEGPFDHMMLTTRMKVSIVDAILEKYKLTKRD